MIRMYVLDVPEFAPLVAAATCMPDCRVTAATKGYWLIQSATELSFNRKELGLKPAVWYGAFTGGLDGDIVEFGQTVVRIVPAGPVAG